MKEEVMRINSELDIAITIFFLLLSIRCTDTCLIERRIKFGIRIHIVPKV